MTAHQALMASVGAPLDSGPAPSAACASSAATHVTYMESHRGGGTAGQSADELLTQVQELAINFALTAATLVHVGMPRPSALSTSILAIEASFKRSVRVESEAELAAALAGAGGPVFLLVGGEPAPGCASVPVLPMLRAVFGGGWAHGGASVALLANGHKFWGMGATECLGAPHHCQPTFLDVSSFLCKVAPGMNQGMWRTHMRVYPPPEAPWPAKVPVPIPPANMWDKFTMGGKAGVGVFYIQVRAAAPQGGGG